MLETVYTANMNSQQRAWFLAEYERVRKDEVVGVLFALLLGGFGIHRFYMGQNGLGVIYLLFSWTGIPSIAGFVECFFMPGRVRAYNALQAQTLAAMVFGPAGPVASSPSPIAPSPMSAPSASAMFCRECGRTVDAHALFCPHCGAALGSTA
jgi:TM2 domain-containing membrane protein YozV